MEQSIELLTELVLSFAAGFLIAKAVYKKRES